MNKRIGICIGDITGIGPEVTLKAISQDSVGGDCDFVLFGDGDHLQTLANRLGLTSGLPNSVEIVNTFTGKLVDNLQPGAAPAANAAVAWLGEAANWCLNGKIDAMVTAPVSKEAIVRAGHKFIGQTEFLSDVARTDKTVMMLLGEDDRRRWLRVALATTHVPIRSLPDALTRDKVVLAIELAAKACGDLGLSRAKVAVCGFNPHAGEGGKMGTEEIDVIAPAVSEARSKGIDVSGPYSADALFYYVYRGDHDTVVAMYHDQGLAPLKMVCFESGINWTLGLPFIRTSPDHGTAYDIAGRGIASPSSMIAAIRLAGQLAPARPR